MLLLCLALPLAAAPHAFAADAPPEPSGGPPPPPPPPPPEPGMEPARSAASAPCGDGVEIQTSFDPDGKLELIDLDLARKLGLFVNENPGFREARLFQQSEGGLVLELSSERDRRLVRRRTLLNLAAAAALKADVTQRLATRVPTGTLNQEGRLVLLLGSTVLGLGFYGWSVPTALDVQDARATTGLYMLISAASFFVPWLVTQDQSVTWAMTDLALYGATRGIFHGAFLSEVILGDNTPSRAPLLFGALLSLGEGVGGYLVASQLRLDAGTTHLIGNGGDFGAALFTGIALMIQPEGASTPRLTFGMTLGGAALGTLGGYMLATQRSYTWGDAEMMRLPGFIGGVAGFTLGDAATGLAEKPTIAFSLVGAIGGYLLGDFLVKDQHFTAGEAVITDLATVASGLFGAGLVFLLGSQKSTTFETAAVVGASGGFALMYGIFASQHGPHLADGAPHLQLQLNPAGFARTARQTTSALPPSLVTLSWLPD